MRSRPAETRLLVARGSGLALAACAAGAAVSTVVEVIGGGPEAGALAASALALAVPGLVLVRVGRVPAQAARTSVLAAVLLVWLVLAIAASVPYVLAGTFDGVGLALFESVSGVTTTAMTVLRSPEQQSEGILLWRATTQWIGGLAVLLLVAGVLPAVRAGGADPLDRRSGRGDLGKRLTAVMRHLAPLYAGFTVVVAVAYAVAGMDAFDAVAHALTTASTGGFSTKRLSFSAFDSAALEWVATAAMVLAGLSLPFIWRAVRGRPGRLAEGVEVKWYLAIVAAVAVTAVVWNASGGLDADEVRNSVFTAVSAASTTGYTVLGLGGILSPAQPVILLAMAIGPCSGSLGGGLKVERVIALTSWARRDLVRQLHPDVVRPIRVGHAAVEEGAARQVVGYFTVTILLALTAMVAVAAFGEDLLTAVSATVSALGNAGPALGAVAPPATAAELAGGSQLVLVGVMLLGRLEVFPVLVGAGAVAHAARARAGWVRGRIHDRIVR